VALESRQKALAYGGSTVGVSLVANERTPRRLDPDAASEWVAGKLPTPKSPGLKVHNVRVVMEGPAARRATIFSALDKAKVARVVQ
jgi:hypothetical protein